LIDYIKTQEQHHANEDFVDELKRMVKAAHLEWKPEHLP
jgi:hypothetical protein